LPQPTKPTIFRQQPNGEPKIMFKWIRRRRLTSDARKRLLLVAARSEEAIVNTHVANLVDLLESLGDEIDFDRAVELYAEMMSLDEAMGTSVTNRLLAQLETPEPRPAGARRRYRNVFRHGAE
jgi:hypothetical protein